MGSLVRAMDDGGDGPVVVYVPGVDGTGELLLDTAQVLRESFRVVRLRYAADVLPSIGAGYRELAADVVLTLDELGIDRALLLAESFGVALALQIALDHPEHVRGLGLVNGFAHYPCRWRLALARTVMPRVPGFLFRLGRRLTIPMGMIAPRSDPLVVRGMLGRADDYFGAAFLRRLALIREVDLRPQLEEISCPVALFASENDRVVPSVACAREMEAGLPDATLETLGHAGHVILPFNDEPWVARLLDLERRA